ncbi:polyadenylate-binding protein-interacting protein 12-like [Herrania umbratica]|uniref:Polyadenylate-binding protein-interacting protein 12-like n=1 Tax=Herrania umbratica TaxID=108875 RepID=A0A6J1BN11_9ROSI|nr:polyadenylate-binding protein-interacting protein 12-like [Herrania umbratica]XP_021300488.1 polyadenylate-binding protein-interacting protein 12-like [Herrania umbratica]XP_021300496.1 polyadenylate-binding protein-interacting protein 12-like [Herrania umbratica]
MAVAENAGAKIGSSGQNLENTVVSSDSNAVNDPDKSKTRTDSVTAAKTTKEANFQQEQPAAAVNSNGDSNTQMQKGFSEKNQHQVGAKTAGFNRFSNLENGDNGEIFKNDMRDLVEILSKLNPLAEEFVPPSLANHPRHHNFNDNHDQNQNQTNPFLENGFGYDTDNFVAGDVNGHTNRRKRNNFSQGKRRLNNRTSMAQREDAIRKTVYVSDIDLQVTEEHLAGLFLSCGPVVDCRICGDPNSVLRFAFVEFYKEEDARVALNLSGTMLGFYPVRVLPSKTAIAPVNPTFLPRSEDEREMCTRTIYCTNIDKKVTQADVKLFFESVCGEVHRLRLLGDYHHSTRIAFVEFAMAESAIAALNCSGAVLGSLPIRVSPSKTPVRPRALRPAMH